MSEVKVNKITPRTDCGTTQLGDSGDTVTVTGDLRSNSLKAADGGVIISQSGTTITVGASGDTVSLASGASQSGFGRSGTVDWQTSIKTSNFDAVSGQGFFVNSGSGAITATLPTSPSAGDIVSIADYGFNAATSEYGDMISMGILDPAKVTRTALQAAGSVAGLMITTEAMVSEIPEESPAGGMPGGMPPGMGGMDGMM